MVSRKITLICLIFCKLLESYCFYYDDTTVTISHECHFVSFRLFKDRLLYSLFDSNSSLMLLFYLTAWYLIHMCALSIRLSCLENIGNVFWHLQTISPYPPVLMDYSCLCDQGSLLGVLRGLYVVKSNHLHLNGKILHHLGVYRSGCMTNYSFSRISNFLWIYK